jgi:hypothetical protein
MSGIEELFDEDFFSLFAHAERARNEEDDEWSVGGMAAGWCEEMGKKCDEGMM